eukprot:4491211-Pleurochrysis_carterae.AAC.1
MLDSFRVLHSAANMPGPPESLLSQRQMVQVDHYAPPSNPTAAAWSAASGSATQGVASTV